MPQNVGKQGQSLLILLGLRDAEIEMLRNDNPHNYTNAIHGGLLKFKDRGGTWGELIEAMKEAAIGLEYIEGLKGELNSIYLLLAILTCREMDLLYFLL